MTFSLQFPHRTVTSPPPCAILKEIAEIDRTEHRVSREILSAPERLPRRCAPRNDVISWLSLPNKFIAVLLTFVFAGKAKQSLAISFPLSVSSGISSVPLCSVFSVFSSYRLKGVLYSLCFSCFKPALSLLAEAFYSFG